MDFLYFILESINSLLDGETNPSYEPEDENDSFDNVGSLRKDTAPAIQSTVLPWKQDSSKDANGGNGKRFNDTMNKPVKQEEFPPHWTAASGATGDESKSSSGRFYCSYMVICAFFN